MTTMLPPLDDPTLVERITRLERERVGLGAGPALDAEGTTLLAWIDSELDRLYTLLLERDPD